MNVEGFGGCIEGCGVCVEGWEVSVEVRGGCLAVEVPPFGDSVEDVSSHPQHYPREVSPKDGSTLSPTFPLNTHKRPLVGASQGRSWSPWGGIGAILRAYIAKS